MAYTDDAVLSKLSALNESHESIATTAQWIMFHRRHASQTVHLWLTKLKELPSTKRLNMIYLANEVVQQSKARHKEDFHQAFTPFIADATSLAYKGASIDLQNKIRRVVDVWKERSIFDRETLQGVEARLSDIDRSKGASGGGFVFGTQAAPAIPPELNLLVPLQNALNRSIQPAKTALSTVESDFAKIVAPAGAPPAAPVHAARLNGLLKSLATAEGAVSERIRARRELIRGLERLLGENRELIQQDEECCKDIKSRKVKVERNKEQVELEIMGGLQTNMAVGADGSSKPSETESPVAEPDRPMVEALTPPDTRDDDDDEDADMYGEGSEAPAADAAAPAAATGFPTSAPGIEILSNLASQYQAVPLNGSVSNKKRKIDAASADEFPDLGKDDGIDADVKEMLRQESRAL